MIDQPRRSVVAGDLQRVRSVVMAEVSRPGGMLAQALTDLATRPSKLLRPRCALLTAHAASGGKPASEDLIRGAAAIELLHMATLVHDDIVDRAGVRRGAPALHLRYGTRAAVLMGDYLFARTMSLLTQHANEDNAAMAARAVGHLIDAEIAEAYSDPALSARAYLRRVVGKTAVLFALSFQLGVADQVGADAPFDPLVSHMRRVGYNFGVAFQITDDMLDMFGDPARTGKPRGLDLRLGLATLPLILAARGSQGRRLARRFERAHRSRIAPVQALRLRGLSRDPRLRSGIEVATERVERYVSRATRSLATLEAGPARDELIELVNGVNGRAA